MKSTDIKNHKTSISQTHNRRERERISRIEGIQTNVIRIESPKDIGITGV